MTPITVSLGELRAKDDIAHWRCHTHGCNAMPWWRIEHYNAANDVLFDAYRIDRCECCGDLTGDDKPGFWQPISDVFDAIGQGLRAILGGDQ